MAIIYNPVSDNTFSVLSKTEGVSATSINNTLLYTVPAGKRLNIQAISIVVRTVVGTAATTPSISIGSNATLYNNIMANVSMLNVTTVDRAYNFPIVGAIPLVAASGTVFARVNTAAVAIGVFDLTYDITIYGELI